MKEDKKGTGRSWTFVLMFTRQSTAVCCRYFTPVLYGSVALARFEPAFIKLLPIKAVAKRYSTIYSTTVPIMVTIVHFILTFAEIYIHIACSSVQ